MLVGDSASARCAEGPPDAGRRLVNCRLAACQLHPLRPVADPQRDRCAAGAAAVPAMAVDDHRGFRPRPKRDRPTTTPALGRTTAVLRNSVHLRRTSSRVTWPPRRLRDACPILV